MNKWGLISLVPLLLFAVLLSGCGSTAAVPQSDGVAPAEGNRSAPVQQGETTTQLTLQAASTSVAAGRTVAFTVTFHNGEATEVTLSTPCGSAFNLAVTADGQEIDDWLRQTYGGPPVCPPGQVRVAPGESYSTTLSLRFPKRGTFSVYASNLGGLSFTAGNIRSNPVTIHVR